MNNEVNNLMKNVKELVHIARQLDDLEDTLLERLNDGEEEANVILDSAIDEAEQKYQVIGKELNRLGGFNLMQVALQIVPAHKGAHSVRNSAWNGIGQWQE